MITRSASAFTLIEVLVSSALAILLLSLTVKLVSSGYRITHEEFERSATESKILILNNHFGRDLALTSSAGISLSTTGESLVMQPLTLSDSTSVVYEDKFVAWMFQSASESVGRFESDGIPAVPFTGEAIRLDESLLTTINTSSEFKLSRTFPKIEAFQVSNTPGVDHPFVGSHLKLMLSVELDRARTRKDITFEQTYQLRTSGL